MIVAAAGCVVIVSAGTGFDVTANAAELAEQPLASVTVTVYEPAAVTVIVCVVAPVDQRFPVIEDDVSVTVLPVQTSEFPAVMVGLATAGFAVTVKGADVAEQPPASVTLTV